MRKLGLIGLFLLALVLLVASQTNSDNLMDKLGDLTKALPLVVKNDQLGTFFSQTVDERYRTVNDPKNQSRIQRLINQAYPHLKYKDTKFQATILANFAYNAISIYGGHLKFFQGLVRDTEYSDDELAFVVFHEIAHSELGHNREMVETFKWQVGADLALNLSKKTPQFLNLALNALMASRSRDHEKEADAWALEVMAKTKHNLRGAIASFARIQAEHKIEQEKYGNNLAKQRFAQIFATHPEPESRLDKAEDFLFTQKFGSTFKQVKGDQAIPVADGFDWPVGPIENQDTTGVALDRDQLSEGGWYVALKFQEIWGKRAPHLGVDINWRSGSADLGQPVFAVASGKVLDIRQPTDSSNDPWRGIVLIEHRLPDGSSVFSQSAHLGFIESNVTKESPIQKGQRLGTIGPTPKNSQSPHLHFEMRTNSKIGIAEDPYRYDNPGYIDPIDFIHKHRRLSAPSSSNRVLILKGPVHLGDDAKGSQVQTEKTFNFRQTEATLIARVKGLPRKDPIFWINRQEVGRVSVPDNQWHQYHFPVSAKLLNDGQNLCHIRSFIPNRWQTFDECEVADVYIIVGPYTGGGGSW